MSKVLEGSAVTLESLPKRPGADLASKRFSLNFFSKERRFSIASLPETHPEPLSKHISQDFSVMDDSIISKSFGDLDIDCDSFISLPPANSSPCIAEAFTADASPTQTSSHTYAFTNAYNTHSRRTSVHSHSNQSILQSRHSPTKKFRSTSSPHSRKKEDWYEEFKFLESEYHRFMSKTGVNKANVLRLALLPFLRQQRGEFFRVTPEEGTRRVRILQKWWAGLLSALRDRDRPVSGSDRSAYLEAISGILARNEWMTTDNHSYFETLLNNTLAYVIAKLSLKTVSVTFAAFAGKVLAYSFFYTPGVASVLLYLLHVAQPDVRRLLKVSFSNNNDLNQYTDLETASNLISSSFPSHLFSLIGCTSINSAPPCPASSPGLYGPWVRRWTCFNSDVFFSFLKHYYTIISRLLPAELPWNTHLACPGLIIIHTFLLSSLDSVVHPRKPK